MSGSLKREADFKQTIARLTRQRDEFRRLPAQLEAAQREATRWQESSSRYATENAALREQLQSMLCQRCRDAIAPGEPPKESP